MRNEATDRLVLGVAGGGWVMTRPEHALMVLGPPRSGKTTGVVVPNVLAAPGPVLSTSTKPDVLIATLVARSRLGRCWLYDPTGEAEVPPGAEALRWSPVLPSRNWDTAVMLAQTLVGTGHPREGESAHWSERAEALLSPLLHAAALSGDDMRTVTGWVNRREAARALQVLEAAGAGYALDLLTGVADTDARELSGIWSTTSGALAAYRSSAALATTDSPNFDPAAFAGSTDTVFICAPGHRQAGVAPLVASLVDQIRQARYRLHHQHARSGAVDGDHFVSRLPPLFLALDEVANIAPLPELPSLVSEGGSQGVLTLACFQDLSQARSRWGRGADGFMTLFGSKLIFPGVADVATLEAVSALCGQHEVVTRSSNRTGLRRTTGWSTRRQPRLSVEEVRRGRPGTALLVDTDAASTWVRLIPHDRGRDGIDSRANVSDRRRGRGREI